nr:MFS transporter [uncultured Caproiciproducens sp.]
MNRKNVYLFYAIALFQGMVFYAPIATLYRQARGLGIFEITLIESVSMIVSLALEIPWGFIADKIGYKKTILLCNFLYFLSKIVFWKANGFGMFLLERLMLSVVISGLSGCDSAFLYLSAGKANAMRVFGIYSAMGSAGLLAASAVFSLFLRGNTSLSALLTVFSYGISLILTIFSTEVENHVENSKNFLKQAAELLGVLKKQKRFMLFLVAAALLAECNQTITVFLNQLQYLRGGIQPQAMGFLYILVIISGLFAARSHRLVEKLGESRVSILLFLAGGASCLLMALFSNPVLSVGCMILLRVSSALFVPVQMNVENRSISTANRAAILSAYSIVTDLVAAGTNLTFGRAAEIGVPSAMLLGAGFCFSAFLLYCIWRRAGNR